MVNAPLDRSLFNLDLLVITPEHIKFMGEVKTGIIFLSNTQDFHPDGLYSTSIFGPVGSELRNSKTGYIDMKLKVFHPIMYSTIEDLKAAYINIILGKQYAKFDNKLKDFVFTTKDEPGSDTGFHFFLEHYRKLNPVNLGEGSARDFKIKFFNKYKGEEYLCDKCLVLPAGLRDYTINKQGRPTEDEVNNLYRKLLISCSLLNNTNINSLSPKMLDPIRIKLQKTFNSIFNYFYTMLDGKEKFIQAKWAKRTIENGTRNVLTSFPEKVFDLNKENSVTNLNMTAIGLYQYVKAITPVTIFHIQSKVSNKIFNMNSDKVLLIDPDTLKSGYFTIPVKKRDEWLSIEGITGLMEKINSIDARESPIKIDKYYMFMCSDDGKNVVVYRHTDEIPTDVNPKHLRPLKYIELFYIAIYEIRTKYPAFITRFPITSLGSIYPSKVNVKTTVNSRVIQMNFLGLEFEMEEYPIFGEEYLVSTSVHNTRLKRLGADFDGDMVTCTIVYSEEAIKEIMEFLSSNKAYLTSDNKIISSSSNGVSEQVTAYMTE